jgi:hypothetical protein
MQGPTRIEKIGNRKSFIGKKGSHHKKKKGHRGAEGAMRRMSEQGRMREMMEKMKSREEDESEK